MFIQYKIQLITRKTAHLNLRSACNTSAFRRNFRSSGRSSWKSNGSFSFGARRLMMSTYRPSSSTRKLREWSSNFCQHCVVTLSQYHMDSETRSWRNSNSMPSSLIVQLRRATCRNGVRVVSRNICINTSFTSSLFSW